jgi:predicted double-glycine peptidase
MAGSRRHRAGGAYGCALRRGAAAIVLLASVLAASGGPVGAATRASPTRPGVAVVPSGVAGSVGSLPQIWQTYNNCGPASVAEVLAYWGIARTQDQVQRVLRADNNPHGMAPYGVPSYARSLGLRALLGVVGTPRLLKALVTNGFPVIVNQWYSVAEHTRHYRPIQAYDDRQGVFVSSDPFGGPGHAITYADFAATWTVSNNRFIVLFPPAKARLLDAVLASAGWNKSQAYQRDLRRLKARLRSGRVSSTTSGSRAFRYYAYLNIAWDEVELGQYTAARQELRQATAHGANPILVHWVAGEIPPH